MFDRTAAAETSNDPADAADPTLVWTRCLVNGMMTSARVIALAEATLATQIVALAQTRHDEADFDAEADRAAGRQVVMGPEQVERAVADEVGAAMRWSPRVAASRIAAARNLIERAPGTYAALAGGRIDAARAYRIAEGLAVLSPESAAEVEAQVLARAGDQTPTQVAAAVRRAVIAADPAAADRAHAAARARRHARTRAEDDGMASIWLYGPADQIAAAWQTITAVGQHQIDQHRSNHERTRTSAEPAPAAPTLDQARVDAALAMLRCPDALPEAGEVLPSIHAEIHLIVPDSTLHTPPTDPVFATPDGPADAGVPPADMPGHGPIPGGLLADLLRAAAERQSSADCHHTHAGASDARVRFTRWITDPTGTVIHASTAYRPPPTMAATIRARDMTCRFPRCTTPADNCDLDHTVPYPAGATDTGNLAALCRRHHRLKTHTRWKLRHLPGAILEWTSPTGHVYVTRPPVWLATEPQRVATTPQPPTPAPERAPF